MHYSPFFLLCFFAIQTIIVHGCFQSEREALLEFKAGVSDSSGRLVSWRGEDCCTWAGIKCSNQTGHVVKLNLANPSYFWDNNSLSGEISPSLLALDDLKHLDLSNNNFSGSMFPKFVCSFRKLKHLDLSMMGLSGMIPSQLGNLSRLQYLNLDSILDVNYPSPSIHTTGIWWLSQLTSLKYLDISGVNLQDSKKWVQALNMLPSLEILILEENNLTTIPASLPVLNFSSLTTFFLVDQNFNAPIPAWMGQLTTLTILDIWNCSFIGPVPILFGNFISIRELYLHGNKYLEGPIPSLHNLHNLTSLYLENVNLNEDISELVSKLSNDALKNFESLVLVNTSLTGNLTRWLDKMPNLSGLFLDNNKLNGIIPTQIGNLSNLVSLGLSQNSFTGDISEAHLIGLSNLKVLELASNSITIKIADNWIPVFQLEYLLANDCKLGPKFPSWLQNQTQLYSLNLSNTNIVDTLPDWFWKLSSLAYIDLSHNKIKGNLLLSLDHFTQLRIINLKYNQFSGAIFPSFPPYLYALDLSHNLLSGPLSLKLESPFLSLLILSDNIFNGSIGRSICGLSNLQILSLSGNNISGSLPNCWPKMLQVVDISNNKLSGTIPSSVSLLNMLLVLQLSKNSLTGELPPSLQFCRNLFSLDLGQNKFHGQIPEWLGKSLSNLRELRLRSNLFYGTIPSNIMHLSKLQVLDLADNNIVGLIPQNLDNLTAMANNISDSTLQLDEFGLQSYRVTLYVVMKSLNLEYSTTPLYSLRSIDLSKNSLMGEMPQSITSLIGLTNLNLSYNHLSGTMPIDIGKIRLIQSLDLRMNNFSGMIPNSLATLSFLATLNLSYNNLSGEIPTGDQLQTINDLYLYIGNAYLCGPPLNKSCNTEIVNHVYSITSNDGLEKIFLYLFVVLGFVFGFWTFFGVLIFKRNWRYRFFQMVDDMFDRIYVFVMLYFARLWRNKAK